MTGAGPVGTKMTHAAGFTISQISRQVRFRPSAIRYYEQIRLLPSGGPARRAHRQRQTEPTRLRTK